MYRRPMLGRSSAIASLSILISTGLCSAHRAVARDALPTPSGYAQTCRLHGEWCAGSGGGSVPERLRRPLHLPRVVAGGGCPITPRRRYANELFAGSVLGSGPVRPLVAPGGRAPFAHGSLAFLRSPGSTRWRSIKTLWFSLAAYDGPVLIRGRRLDKRGVVAFGGSQPALVDPQFAPGATLNGADGIREWPDATWIKAPGCYAWQIDGTTFSSVVVFRARFAGA